MIIEGVSPGLPAQAPLDGEVDDEGGRPLTGIRPKKSSTPFGAIGFEDEPMEEVALHDEGTTTSAA